MRRNDVADPGTNCVGRRRLAQSECDCWRRPEWRRRSGKPHGHQDLRSEMARDRSEGLSDVTAESIRQDLPMNPSFHRRPAGPRRNPQRGSFLLEALISVLIVALGILGLIGLQARAFQNIDDAQYRAEAAYMANALLGQMWVYDRTKLI